MRNFCSKKSKILGRLYLACGYDNQCKTKRHVRQCAIYDKGSMEEITWRALHFFHQVFHFSGLFQGEYHSVQIWIFCPCSRFFFLLYKPFYISKLSQRKAFKGAKLTAREPCMPKLVLLSLKSRAATNNYIYRLIYQQFICQIQSFPLLNQMSKANIQSVQNRNKYHIPVDNGTNSFLEDLCLKYEKRVFIT